MSFSGFVSSVLLLIWFFFILEEVVMKKFAILVVCFLIGCLCVSFLPSVEAAQQTATWVAPEVLGAPVEKTVDVKVEATEAPPFSAVKVQPGARASVNGDVEILTRAGTTVDLSYRERRAMGLSRLSVRRILRDMKKDGFEAEDSEEMAYELQDRLVEKYPKAWEDAARKNGVMASEVDGKVMLDWTGFLAFLEGLMPIILAFLSIFGL